MIPFGKQQQEFPLKKFFNQFLFKKII